MTPRSINGRDCSLVTMTVFFHPMGSRWSIPVIASARNVSSISETGTDDRLGVGTPIIMALTEPKRLSPVVSACEFQHFRDSRRCVRSNQISLTSQSSIISRKLAQKFPAVTAECCPIRRSSHPRAISVVEYIRFSPTRNIAGVGRDIETPRVNSVDDDPTVGKIEAARDVGQAMANNPVALIIPCHRVLARLRTGLDLT